MKLGGTGRLPDGMTRPDDEGELRFAVGRDKRGNVQVDFGKPVAWFALPPDQAKALAALLIKHAEGK